MQEIEIKLLKIDKEDIIKKLTQLHAQFIEDTRISDQFFDYPDKRLWNKREALRLRKKANKAQLVFKGAPDRSQGFAISDEYEINIEDTKKLEKILTSVGFICILHREKQRITYKMYDCLVELDKFPDIPWYLEVEGTKENILKVINALGYTFADTTAMSAFAVIEKYGKDPYKQKFEKK